jgi:hypothetical protein
MKRCLFLLAATISGFCPTFGYSQEANRFELARAARAERCMLRVLGDQSGVELLSWRLPSLLVRDQDWQPFLTYKQHGHIISFEFEWYRSNKGNFGLTFSAGVPTGLSSEPSDWGTEAIEKMWKRRCSVSAWTVIA